MVLSSNGVCIVNMTIVVLDSNLVCIVNMEICTGVCMIDMAIIVFVRLGWASVADSTRSMFIILIYILHSWSFGSIRKPALWSRGFGGVTF